MMELEGDEKVLPFLAVAVRDIVPEAFDACVVHAPSYAPS